MQKLQVILRKLYFDELDGLLINVDYWKDLFYENFLFISSPTQAKEAVDRNGYIMEEGKKINLEMRSSIIEGEDILFLVHQSAPPSTRVPPNDGEVDAKLSVIRRSKRSAEQLENISFHLNWEAAFYLNLICRLRCYLRVSICEGPNRDKEVASGNSAAYQLKSSVNKRVYAEPTDAESYLRPSDIEDSSVSFSYPFIYFTVTDFDTAFGEMVLKPNELLCVELCCVLDDFEEFQQEFFAKKELYEPIADNPAKLLVLFQGSVTYEALRSVHSKRISIRRGSTRRLLMKGPEGKGMAQVEATNIHQSAFPVGLLQTGLRKLTLSSARLSLQETPIQCRLTFIKIHWKLIIMDLFRLFKQAPNSDCE